jgi:hypothetical protein
VTAFFNRYGYESGSVFLSVHSKGGRASALVDHMPVIVLLSSTSDICNDSSDPIYPSKWTLKNHSIYSAH